jgi:hypothetical protein
MVKPPPTIVLCTIFSIMLACASEDRVAKLEKQVDELRVESRKNRAVADFDLQGKCAKDSRGWFNENWNRDKDTILLDYSSHYNRAQNKCFVLVEFHYTLDKSGSWTGDMMLWDVYENTKYGNFTENHMISFNPTVRPDFSSWNLEERVNARSGGWNPCGTADPVILRVA